MYIRSYCCHCYVLRATNCSCMEVCRFRKPQMQVIDDWEVVPDL